MAGQFHTAVFGLTSDTARAEMAEWLTEQSAAGWEPVSISIVGGKSLVSGAQALVVVRRENP